VDRDLCLFGSYQGPKDLEQYQHIAGTQKKKKKTYRVNRWITSSYDLHIYKSSLGLVLYMHEHKTSHLGGCREGKDWSGSTGGSERLNVRGSLPLQSGQPYNWGPSLSQWSSSCVSLNFIISCLFLTEGGKYHLIRYRSTQKSYYSLPKNTIAKSKGKWQAGWNVLYERQRAHQVTGKIQTRNL
jgi:hypothetical protein